jgi:hypothetical protein
MPIASRVVSLSSHSDIDKMETEKSQNSFNPDPRWRGEEH